jgi:hypothetical protein
VMVCAAPLLAGCTSTPGETTASLSMQRDIRDRVLAAARGVDPQCRQQRIGTTEMLQVHPDGQAAEELWQVESCGRRLNYVVSFPPKRAAGSSLGFSIRPER